MYMYVFHMYVCVTTNIIFQYHILQTAFVLWEVRMYLYYVDLFKFPKRPLRNATSLYILYNRGAKIFQQSR